MSATLIVWVLLISSPHIRTVGGVFTSRELCETASKEVPEEGVKFTCLQRQLWSKDNAHR